MTFEDRVKNLEPFGQLTFLQIKDSQKGYLWYCYIDLFIVTKGVDFRIRSDAVEDIGLALLDLENKIHETKSEVCKLPSID